MASLRLLIGLAAVLGLGSPVAAQTERAKPVREARSSQADTDEIARQLESYGQWTLALSTAAEPAFEGARALQGEWGQVVNNLTPASIAGFNRKIDEIGADIAGARAAVAALDTPAFQAIDLPDDLETPVMRQQMLETLAQMADMVATFRPLLASIVDRDEAAGARAGAQMLRSARVLYDSQRLFARTAVATSEPDTPEYHVAEFDVLFFELGSRAIASASLMLDGGTDPALLGDLLILADRMDEVVANAVETARVQKAEAEDRATSRGRRSEQEIADRAQRIDAMSTENIAIWRRFSDALRESATAMKDRTVTMADVNLVTRHFGPTRLALDAIAIRQMEVLAGQ